MPALEACGRRWEFGSDDLVLPAAISVIARTFLFIGVAIGVVYFREALICQHSHLMASFAFSELGILLVTILLEGGITIFSGRGTIVRTKPRKPVVHLLHIRMFVFLLEIILLVVGTAFALKTRSEEDKLECPNLDDAVLVTTIIVTVGWCVLLIALITILIYLDPCHCYSAKVNYSIVERHVRDGNIDRTIIAQQWELTHSVWEKRFRVACCFTGSDDTHQVAYREVAEIFAHLFCDVNVVPSDIAAGMVLLQKQRFSHEQKCRNDPDVPDHVCNGVPFDFRNPTEREIFRTALHLLKYALGIYSWPFYVYMNPFCGCCRLLSRLQCCPCWQRKRHNVVKDNSCACYLHGLRHITGLNEVDIIYVSFVNTVYKPPFFVCLDHETRSVVISVRGTLSLHDLVTDLSASIDPIELPNFPNFLVHKGILKAATWIKEQLDENEILEEAFDKVSGYNLIVVGHSLGSGCATLLCMFLREQYPDLHCFCYSPTGSLLNEAAADYSKEFVTSFTLGQDLVARLSVPSTHQLKEDLIEALESCKKPKFQILFEGGLETLSRCCGKSVVIEDNSRRNLRGEPRSDEDTPEHYSRDPEESLEFTPLLQRDLSSAVLRRTQIASEEVDHALVPLFPPGRVIHLVEIGEPRAFFCGQRRQLEARWAPRENFDRVIVSPDMIRDHFPDVLLNAMECVWKEKMAEIEDDRISRSHSDSSLDSD